MKNKNFKSDNKSNTYLPKISPSIQGSSPGEFGNKNIELGTINSNSNNLNKNYRKSSIKNFNLVNNKIGNVNENVSRKNSNNYDYYSKSDDNVLFSDSEDFDKESGKGTNIRKITVSKSNTGVNQNLNNLGKGSFMYQNAITTNDFDARRPSFLDENFSHKV